jgi:uncharacterized protein (DUF2336 family)
MEGLSSLLSDLDRLVRNRSSNGRAKTFSQVVDLYFASVGIQEDEHVDFFGDVFGLLVDHVGTSELADLGQRIAPVERAPARLIRRLANDDEISVAGPVIAQSKQLTSDDLLMLAQTKGQSHLHAIGSRERVDSTVTAVLVDRADDEVIQTVARNAGAEFSTDGFARLAQRALNDDDLAETVGSRADIPAGVLRALVSQAAETARARILAAASPEMKSEIASAMRSRGGGQQAYAAARKQVSDLHRSGKLAEQEIIRFANSRKLEETVTALELLCGTPADVIRHFMAQLPAETMPVVCKAAGLSWIATEAVINLCGAAGHAVDDASRRKALKDYAKLTKPTAEKILRFWFVRGSSRADHRDQETGEARSAEKQRKGNRRSVDMAASILADGKHIADTAIEDLSMEGAKLRLLAQCTVPDRFVLTLSANRQIQRQCEVRWRTRDHIGVQFS